MSEHVIRWSFEDQHVIAEAICKAAPDADCRLTSADTEDCDCEHWNEIQRRTDGTIWHQSEWDEEQWHRVVPGDECNVCLFLNEGGDIKELTSTMTVVDLGETPIKPVWQDDGCDWEPVA